jgi:hypothetical protein
MGHVHIHSLAIQSFDARYFRSIIEESKIAVEAAHAELDSEAKLQDMLDNTPMEPVEETLATELEDNTAVNAPGAVDMEVH